MTTTRSSKEIAQEIKAINATGRKMNYLQNEGGEGYNHTADTTELEAEFHAAKDQEFASEWTEEVTASRRVEWNASKVTGIKAMLETERVLGYQFSDLKKAIAMYK